MMNNHRRNRVDHIRNNTSKRLKLNLRILLIVYLVLFIVSIVVAFRSHTALWQIVLGFVIGGLVGALSSRMYKISWNHREAQVIGKIDIYGVIVLVLFVLFELNRSHIAGLFAPSEAIGTISLVLVTGALYGRIIGTRNQILHALARGKNISAPKSSD